MNAHLTPTLVKRARLAARRGEAIATIAKRLERNYDVVYNAVRGITWSSIRSVPPVTSAEFKQQRARRVRTLTCANCGQKYRRKGSTSRCGACHAFWMRHGRDRNEYLLNKHIHISEADVRRLHQRYMAGESYEQIAAALPLSAETLRRRFVELDLPRRTNTSKRHVLTERDVRRARQRHYRDGESVAAIARSLGRRYHTVWCAIVGRSWPHVGGLPDRNRPTADSQPCQRCTLPTTHTSGNCRYCRQERQV